MSKASSLIALDSYTVSARVAPGLVTAVPAVLVVILLAPSSQKMLATIWTVLIGAGGLLLLAQLVRDWGLTAQERVFREGLPTTLLLRHTGATPREIQIPRHQALGRLLGRPMPTAAEEAANPAAADETYIAAVAVLRDRTRDAAQFPLVHAEVVNYGFRRNMFALRSIGITIGALGLMASVVVGVSEIRSAGIEIPTIASATLSMLVLLLWWRVINPDWVRRSGAIYADRLLAALSAF